MNATMRALKTPFQEFTRAMDIPLLMRNQISREEILRRNKVYVTAALTPASPEVEEQITQAFLSRLPHATCMFRSACREWATDMMHLVRSGQGSSASSVESSIIRYPLQTCEASDLPTAADIWLQLRRAIVNLSEEDIWRMCMAAHWSPQPYAYELAKRKCLTVLHVVISNISFDVAQKLMVDEARRNSRMVPADDPLTGVSDRTMADRAADTRPEGQKRSSSAGSAAQGTLEVRTQPSSGLPNLGRMMQTPGPESTDNATSVLPVPNLPAGAQEQHPGPFGLADPTEASHGGDTDSADSEEVVSEAP